jgi:hypothetical protein
LNKDVNIRPEAIKVFKENMRGKLQDITFGSDYV